MKKTLFAALSLALCLAFSPHAQASPYNSKVIIHASSLADPGGALAKTDFTSTLTAALNDSSTSIANLHEQLGLGIPQARGVTEVLANSLGIGLSSGKHDSAFYALHLMDNTIKTGMASAKGSGSYMLCDLAGGKAQHMALMPAAVVMEKRSQAIFAYTNSGARYVLRS